MIKRINFFTVFGIIFLLGALTLSGYNFYDEYRAAQSVQNILEDAAEQTDEENNVVGELVVSDYLLDPEMDMPVKTVDGQKYVGVLKIPALSLTLPVLNDWSYGKFKIAPCKYYGSVYQDNMVIAAHNYRRHFGKLKTLKPGNNVSFTDIDGNEFEYEVTEVQILKPRDVEDMTQSEADLTLFTCTVGGRTRVTVRCERIK